MEEGREGEGDEAPMGQNQGSGKRRKEREGKNREKRKDTEILVIEKDRIITNKRQSAASIVST